MTKRKRRSNGVVAWRGESQLDGSPVVLIMTGLSKPSSNPKTGWMIQSWILRSDIHPEEAITTGQDESICGQCPLRGSNGHGRVCYVNRATLGQIYIQFTKGNYPDVDKRNPDCDPLTPFRNRPLRVGAYGDPVAIPVEVWRPYVNVASVVTGYTHQWHLRQAKPYREFCMASVEDLDMARTAHNKGWRTYRIKRPDDILLPQEVACVAETTSNATTCMQCGLCDGNRKKRTGHIVINVHGMNARRF